MYSRFLLIASFLYVLSTSGQAGVLLNFDIDGDKVESLVISDLSPIEGDESRSGDLDDIPSTTSTQTVHEDESNVTFALGSNQSHFRLKEPTGNVRVRDTEDTFWNREVIFRPV